MVLQQGLVLLRRLLDSLNSAGLIEFELVPPSSVTYVDVNAVETALHSFAQGIVQLISEKPLDNGMVQIKAGSREVLERRIEAFVHRKELEREAMLSYVGEGQCSRTVPFRYRRIGVEHVTNEVGPQDLEKSSSPNADLDSRTLLEARLTTVEKHIGLAKSNHQPNPAAASGSAATKSSRTIAHSSGVGTLTSVSGLSSGGPSSRRTSSESVPEKHTTCPTCTSVVASNTATGSLNSLELLHRMKMIEDRLLYLESVTPEYSAIIPTADAAHSG